MTALHEYKWERPSFWQRVKAWFRRENAFLSVPKNRENILDMIVDIHPNETPFLNMTRPAEHQEGD